MKAVLHPDTWNAAVLCSLFPSFMQSWEWGEAQRQFGLQVGRLTEGDGQALVVQRPLPFARSWLYVPRGPIVGQWRRSELGKDILRGITDFARERRCVFVRADPVVPAGVPEAVAWRDGLAAAGFVPAVRQVQPQHTLTVDLSLQDAQLLAVMHPKTRYNIRLAQRKGVHIRFSTAQEDLAHFLRLARAVQARGSFRYHPPAYYRAMLAALTAADLPGGQAARAELAVAECAGDVLAVHILIRFGDTVTYAHGASSQAQREVMAPHLLQWASLQRARKAGARWYDFFGVAPSSASNKVGNDSHPWAGITRFKEGFGGQRVGYLGAYDLVLEPAVYTGLNIVRRLRRLL